MSKHSTLALMILLCGQLCACFPAVVAGVGAGVTLSQDRRPTSMVWKDQEIESRIGKAITDKYGKLTHVNITSFNQSVLLTGEVTDDAARADIAAMTNQAQDVKRVFNETLVRLPSSLTARANDSAITTKVKARMLDAGKFSAVHVKVVTERNQVFLLGLVSQQEAKDAAEIASSTGAVEKVITLFEYIEPK